MPLSHRLLRALALLLGLCSAFAAAAFAQTHVENTATLTVRNGAAEQLVRSNTVGFDVAIAKRPTVLSFHLPPPGYAFTGMACDTGGSVPQFTPAPIDAATYAASPLAKAVDIYTDMILVLDNQAGNHDPLTRETATIAVQVGTIHTTLVLIETGADTGIFAGGIPATATGRYPALDPCEIRNQRGAAITLSFTEDDYSLASTIQLLIDPAGLVFDSANGQLVDGATVTLLDAQGQPASVYGDDGVSRYPSTVVSGASVTDARGRIYPAETGRYRFPLVPPGQYTLKVVPPEGYAAPSKVAHATLAAFKDPSGHPFVLNEASYGGVLTLETPDPFYADIPIDRSGDAPLLLTKTASVRDASPGDVIQYRLQLANRGKSPSGALHIADTLPIGLHYTRGSTRGGAEPGVTPNGRDLDFAVPALAPGASVELRYLVTVAPGAPVGEARNRAQVSGGASNEAIASVRLGALLFTDAMTLIGRVTEGACGDPVDHRRGVPGIRLLLEDGTFTVTDRDGLYHFEGVRPGTHVVQLDTQSVPATHAPVACDRDTRSAGSAIARYVEASGGLMKRVDFQLAPTGKAAAAVQPLPIAVADDAVAAGNRDWLAGQTPGTGWLFPGEDYNPRAPVLRVAIKHAPDQRVALTVNGAQVDPLSFDATDTDGHGVAVSKWSGLPLLAGDNRLVARVLDSRGATVATLERGVHVSGAGRTAVFDPAHSRLVADGLTRPLIAVRVIDKAGRPVQAGTLVPFRVDAPYTAAIEAALEQGRQLAGRERSATTARVVGDDGLAFVALQPTTQAGAAHVTVTLTDDKVERKTEIRAWLAASARDWTLVGFGKGTLGYNVLRAHDEALPRADRDRVTTDGQLALYAKGRVKGSWLLTIAYDSKRAYDPTRGLLGTIDPNRYYTVYGDGALQGYDAPTRRKIYVRLERREAYALFGDFETGFTDTQLLRYDRTLNGVKAAYEGRRVRATGFAAHTDQRYARDEIQGSGLSGPYRLAARGIVPNSDKITIEVRDRFRSEVIVSSTSLTRHIDYDIDPDMGTIRFREPVLGRDAALNPVFIVVDYEVESGQSAKLAAAARVATRLAGDRVELGLGAIRDETIGRATVLGADVKAHLTRTTEIRAEFADGGKGGLAAGHAYLAELDHHGGRLDMLGYVRRQDSGFGVGQQNFVEAGTRKIGFDAHWRWSNALSVTAVAWNQAQLVGDGQRTAGEARIDWRHGTDTLFAGVQIAEDRGLDGKDRDSRLLTLGGSRALFDGALVVGGQTQFAPGGDKDSVDFPIRHQLTASYRVTPGIRLIGGYEIADGADFVAHTARLGFDVAPWTGAKLMSTLNQQAVGENGQRTYAQYGLSQSLPLGRRWTIDATLDASSTISGHIDPGAQVNAFQPAASGGFVGQDQTNGRYAAATLGATYRAARWSWNGRLEHRSSDANDRWGITTNMLRTLGEGRTLASSIKAYTLRDAAGAQGTYASADIALALRPLDSRWSLLERLELRHERADAGLTDTNLLGVSAGGVGDQVTTRAINNLAIDYRSGAEGARHALEVTVYYGAKYIAGRFADDAYTGFVDVTGFELRRDIGRRFDLGVAGSVQHGWSAGAFSFSGGPSAGVSPAPNVWISAGYNVAGYRDRDFEADRYTRAGPYVTMRLKFDQASLGHAARALTGRGS
ncbi:MULTISPECIES: hypothetical protein [unclassified Sphingomonas]|uniref:hypothetical protein n=1 Tax=unclassified Sphingomonas TaxID=196159 RepID=UPI002269AC82|nr:MULTISPECIES: hypothetical protein [unclassified Sphingomonas]